KKLRWICHSFESASRHLENADLICRSEPILSCPDDPMIVVPVAFKIEDRVHDVFERLWAGNRAFFSYVAGDKDRHTGSLGQHHQSAGGLAHLRNTARSRLDTVAVDRLYRIDDGEAGPHLLDQA